MLNKQQFKISLFTLMAITGLVFLLSLTCIIYQGIQNLIDYSQSLSLTIMACIGYTQLKYQYFQKLVTITFIIIIIQIIVIQIILVWLGFFVFKYIENQLKMVEQLLNSTKLYGLYILYSIVLLTAIIYFGMWLSFTVDLEPCIQIPNDFNILMSLGAVIFLLTLCGWILIVFWAISRNIKYRSKQQNKRANIIQLRHLDTDNNSRIKPLLQNNLSQIIEQLQNQLYSQNQENIKNNYDKPIQPIQPIQLQNQSPQNKINQLKLKPNAIYEIKRDQHQRLSEPSFNDDNNIFDRENVIDQNQIKYVIIPESRQKNDLMYFNEQTAKTQKINQQKNDSKEQYIQEVYFKYNGNQQIKVVKKLKIAQIANYSPRNTFNLSTSKVKRVQNQQKIKQAKISQSKLKNNIHKNSQKYKKLMIQINQEPGELFFFRKRQEKSLSKVKLYEEQQNYLDHYYQSILPENCDIVQNDKKQHLFQRQRAYINKLNDSKKDPTLIDYLQKKYVN